MYNVCEDFRGDGVAMTPQDMWEYVFYFVIVKFW